MFEDVEDGKNEHKNLQEPEVGGAAAAQKMLFFVNLKPRTPNTKRVGGEAGRC